MTDALAAPEQVCSTDETTEPAWFLAGIRFTELTFADKDRIISYVFQVQRMLLARGICTGTFDFGAQRRSAYRVRPLKEAPVRIEMTDPLNPERTVRVEPLDISGGGVKIRYPDRVPSLPSPCTIPYIRIQIPGQREIQCSGEVCWICRLTRGTA